MNKPEVMGLVSRIKTLCGELEAAIGKDGKMSKEEYLAKNEDERAAYDMKQMEDKSDDKESDDESEE
jgi:hypothetical protein